MNTYDRIIKLLNMQPHPEGGFYKESYRSEDIIPQSVLSSDYSGDRSVSTAIYFLLKSEDISRLHRLKSDEIWHFYSGSPLEITIFENESEKQNYILGNDLLCGHIPQLVIPRNYWMVAQPVEPNSYSFVGCTVSPGFDFDDFECFE